MSLLLLMYKESQCFPQATLINRSVHLGLSRDYIDSFCSMGDPYSLCELIDNIEQGICM